MGEKQYASRQVKATLRGDRLKAFDTLMIEKRHCTEAETLRFVFDFYLDNRDLIAKLRAGRLRITE